MGLVFVADQEQPVRRRVALKVVKPGMDTRQVLARFEAERQALALMDHPNIAKVLDAGATESGRPYFVMELVRGVPITEYCDQAQLTTRQRLELFLPVCRAIQHAHQKGVIHRDIKPSNLLVTLYDSHPVPKVIDFGIAKAVGTTVTDHSVYTGFAPLVGTPMYMSPEQAEMTAQDVDTRADVYALGVVLYELLTGTTPFDGEMLRQAGFDEMRRIIREDEPAKPSHRVTTMSAEKQSTVMGQRGVDGRHLDRQLRGGLDWVVMTCLAKDRTRRYESAGALAADIERYLRDEAVEASPPSTSYQMRTFARRNRTSLVAGSLIAAALIAGTGVSVWQAVKARNAQHRAEAELARATTAERISSSISQFLQQDLLLQARNDVQIEHGFVANSDLTVKEALDRAAEKINNRFPDQPLVEAELRRTIGEAYRGVGEHRTRATHLERAVELYRIHLGPDKPETLRTLYDLALAYLAFRRPDGLAMLENVLERQKLVLGPDHEDTLITLNTLGNVTRAPGHYERSLTLISEALERKMATLGPDHAVTANSIHDLGLVLRDLGRYPEAIDRLEEATLKLEASLGATHSNTRFSRQNLSDVYRLVGRYDDAHRVLRDAIQREVQGGNRSPEILAFLWAQLGQSLMKQNNAEAESAYREALAYFEKKHGFGPTRFVTQSLLGECLMKQKKFAEAEPLLILGFEGIKSRVNNANALTREQAEAGERIVRFYEETSNPDKAKEWQAKLRAGNSPD
jgi:serine/threonine protein kinase